MSVVRIKAGDNWACCSSPFHVWLERKPAEGQVTRIMMTWHMFWWLGSDNLWPQNCLLIYVYFLHQPVSHLDLLTQEYSQVCWLSCAGETINTPPTNKNITPSADKVTPREENSNEKGNVDGKTVDHKDNNLDGIEPMKMPIPKAHLSQAERKRLQWQLEKGLLRNLIQSI